MDGTPMVLDLWDEPHNYMMVDDGGGGGSGDGGSSGGGGVFYNLIFSILLHSNFISTALDPGLVDSPPTSIIFAPD